MDCPYCGREYFKVNEKVYICHARSCTITVIEDLKLRREKEMRNETQEVRSRYEERHVAAGAR